MPNDTSTLLLPSEKKKKTNIYIFKKKRREEKKKISLGTIVPVQLKHVPIQLTKKQAVGKFDRPKTRCVKCVPKCASVRVASSNIVY